MRKILLAAATLLGMATTAQAEVNLARPVFADDDAQVCSNHQTWINLYKAMEDRNHRLFADIMRKECTKVPPGTRVIILPQQHPTMQHLGFYNVRVTLEGVPLQWVMDKADLRN